MTRYARIQGVLVEPLGDLWVAYSPANGETAMLNDESAAILEILDDGPADTAAVSEALAADSGLEATALTEKIQACWSLLGESGLVRAVRSGSTWPA